MFSLRPTRETEDFRDESNGEKETTDPIPREEEEEDEEEAEQIAAILRDSMKTKRTNRRLCDEESSSSSCCIVKEGETRRVERNAGNTKRVLHEKEKQGTTFDRFTDETPISGMDSRRFAVN